MLTAAILWQSQLATDHSNLLIVFIAVVAAAVVLQAGVLIAMAIGARKAQAEVLKIMQEIHGKSVPVIDAVSRLVQETSPKISRITDNVSRVSDNLVETTDILRDKAQELDGVVSEVASKTRAQVDRMDSAVTDTFNKVGRVTAEVQHAVLGPVKQISGVLTGVKVGLETLLGKVRGWKDLAVKSALVREDEMFDD